MGVVLAPDPASRGSGLTRRGLIAAGSASAAAAFISGRGGIALAADGGADSEVASHLLRSSYAGLEGRPFRLAAGASATTVTLDAVSDLAGTPAGSDDAFALVFSGPAAEAATQGVKRVTNSQLGSFDMFLVPVDAPGAEQSWEAVVNRSVGAPRRPPAPGGTHGSQEAPEDASTPDGGAARRHAVIRRVSGRRTPRGATLDVLLAPDADVEHVAAWLVRGRRVLGTASRDDVRSRRLTLRVKTRRPVSAAPHALLVIALTADGAMVSKRVPARAALALT